MVSAYHGCLSVMDEKHCLGTVLNCSVVACIGYLQLVPHIPCNQELHTQSHPSTRSLKFMTTSHIPSTAFTSRRRMRLSFVHLTCPAGTHSRIVAYLTHKLQLVAWWTMHMQMAGRAMHSTSADVWCTCTPLHSHASACCCSKRFQVNGRQLKSSRGHYNNCKNCSQSTISSQ